MATATDDVEGDGDGGDVHSDGGGGEGYPRLSKAV